MKPIGCLLLMVLLVNNIPFISIGSNNDEVIIAGEHDEVTLFARNGCGVNNILIVCRGNAEKEVPGTIGTIGFDGKHRVLDTVPGKEINNILIEHNYRHSSVHRLIGAVTDVGVFFYNFRSSGSEVERVHWIPVGNVVMSENNQQMTTIVLVKESADNKYDLYFYNIKDFQLQFKLTIDFIPDKMKFHESDLYIAGAYHDSLYSILQINLDNRSVSVFDTLDILAENVREMAFKPDDEKVFLLSSPGDTMITITEINTRWGLKETVVVDSTTGLKLTANGFLYSHLFTSSILFYFQPININDSSHRHVYAYNYQNDNTYPVIVDHEIDFYWPVVPYAYIPFGYEHITSSWSNGTNDTIHLIKPDKSITHIPVGAMPDFLYPDYLCAMSLDENPAENFKFIAYPNPVGNEINIEISGLESGVKYTVLIFDAKGQLFKAPVQIDEKITLPVSDLPPGLYHIRVETENGIGVTRQFIKK